MIKNNSCRPDKEIKATKTVYIVCEGKNTERIYLRKYIELLIKKINEEEIENFSIIDPYGNNRQNFEFFIQCVNNNGEILDVINIKINHSGYTDPLSIVEDGNKNSKKYDCVYCIFDKDGHVKGRKENYKKALAEKLENNVTIIDSIPFFEYFIRLHFEYSTSEDYCDSSSETFIKEILNKKLELDYTKESKKFSSFFDKNLKDKIIIGIKNSQKLKNQKLTIKTKLHTLLIELFKLITENIKDSDYTTKGKNDKEVIKIMEKIFK